MRTIEEIEKAKVEYESKLTNTKALRAEIEADFVPIKFGVDFHNRIIKFCDIVFYAIMERRPTYFEDDSTQCEAQKRRTIEDTYRLVKSYNINCRLKDVRDTLEALQDHQILSSVFCKRTLVRTYSRDNYRTTYNELMEFLDNTERNYGIRIIKTKIKRRIRSKSY